MYKLKICLEVQGGNFIHYVGRMKISSRYTKNCYWERNISSIARLL